MTSVWDDPELAIASDYVKFENVGDSVAGKVIAVQVHRFDDGKVAPKLIIETDGGDEIAMTAGQIRLKAALAEQRPEPGDHITVTFTQEEKRPGGKTLKHFDVTVTRGGRPAPAPVTPVAAPAPAAPVAAPVAQAAPAADPLAGLTPEQLAAIAALQAGK